MSATTTQLRSQSHSYGFSSVREEYKHTDVGVIPVDWDYDHLGNLATRVGSGITPTGGERVYVTAGRPFLRSQNVGWGVLILDDLAFITDEIHASFAGSQIKEGDVLLNITGASIGRSTVADTTVARGNVNQHVCEIRPDPKRLDSHFLNGFLLSAAGQKQIDSFQAGGNRQGLNYSQIRSFVVPCPPPREQRAIAEALSDVDGLLAALEKLIDKKRTIKQAAMQQLLTGKTRLPGFSGTWETNKIGDLLNYERPDRYIVQNTEYTEHGDVPVLTANKSFILGYTDDLFNVCHNLPTIVFDDFTTDSKYVEFPFKVKSSAIKLLRAKHERVSLAFVFECMQLIRFPLGDHKRYYISEYQNLPLPIPQYDEQQAIVSILSDMDAEIAALERRRDKTRAIKQGIMQALLTGRVRLVEPEPASEQEARTVASERLGVEV